MRAQWGRFLELLRTGFWFVPMVMLALAACLALLLLYLDERVDPGIKATLAWAYSGGPEGARSLLSTIAGSMITAASVTFSLASVALSLASQQYGSRVLRNFMRDRVTQVLLGTFVATFIYSVLVVRAIRGSDYSGGFVPAISVTVAILLSVASLVLLIYFIHHVSASIQASRIVKVIADDLEAAIPRLYPSETGKPLKEVDESHTPMGGASILVPIPKGGYLQTIDADALLALAKKQGLVIELLVKPGDHLVSGHDVARVWGIHAIQQEFGKQLADAFLLGGERTPEQDIRFQFQQLADVVIRALSPGINDPFTAINGIDELETGVALLARRGRVEEKRHDEDGLLRLILPTSSVAEILRETVGHIAIYGAGDHFVMAGLRRVLDTVARDVHDEPDVRALSQLRNELDRREREKPH